MIDHLFFELIQLAVGRKSCLSRTPDAAEWKILYDIAKKQSLVGICFAGIQRFLSCYSQKGENPIVIGLPEMLYLKWMGMAAKIQQRNELVNEQCVELCRNIEEQRFRACVLKGQGTALLYKARDENQEVIDLSALRQSGDIDVWIMPEGVRTLKRSKPQITELVHRLFPNEHGAFVHIGYPVFNDTEVEVHYVPTMDGNPVVDRCFARLFEKHQDECFANVNELGFAIPVPAVNVLFNLHHIKKHFINEGIGLRHVLDLYFVLNSYSHSDIDTELKAMITSLGMKRFYSGIMWVMQQVLGDIPHTFGIKPDAKLGQFILQEIMTGGNFGHHDERLQGVNQMGFIDRWKRYLGLSALRARFFPSDVLWSYVFRMRVGIWRKTGIEI